MDLEVYAEDDWARVVGRDLLAALASAGSPRVCLPTGRTPRPAYAEVARRAGLRGIDTRSASVVLLDEYLGLPPGDMARCDMQIRRDLLDLLPAPPRLIAVDVDALVPEEAAARLDEAARALDLAVVGLGGNGHIGMNEPGSGPDAATRVVELAEQTSAMAVTGYGASHRPDRGITVGLDRLLAATEVWLLATGSGKAAILAQVLEGPRTAELPGSLLRAHPRLRVVVDQAAAAELTRSAITSL